MERSQIWWIYRNGNNPNFGGVYKQGRDIEEKDRYGGSTENLFTLKL